MDWEFDVAPRCGEWDRAEPARSEPHTKVPLEARHRQRSTLRTNPNAARPASDAGLARRSMARPL